MTAMTHDEALEYVSKSLAHYGTPRRSGRYPWGSGEDPYQNNHGFLGYVSKLQKTGMTEKQIADGLGITTTQLRAHKAVAKNEIRKADETTALRLREKGMSNTAIGARMGINESSVRSLLDPANMQKADILQNTSDMLRDQVEKKKYLDVGLGTEAHLGISKEKLATSIAMLEEDGYKLNYVKVKQLGTGKETTLKVLTKDDVDYSELSENRGKIRGITEFSEDGGRSFRAIQPPIPIDPKRVGVRYAEDGGTDADGVIYLRPGVPDLSLGGSRYAQARIQVGADRYLKGMVMYKDDLPDGVDLLFNTNKSNTGNKLDAMKKMKDDPDNPFGAVVRQRDYIDGSGKKKQSPINIVNEEGDWNSWSRSLSSQMLSKQSPALAKEQLAISRKAKKAELDEIMALTNPTVRKKLLESFADDVDSSAVHLKAAALPRQRSQVILPINSLKETEIYAPNFRNGERVALVRYPHGGTFEIPELTVNNRHPQGKKSLGNAMDAVGINSKVAARLSGADFDGDSVLVIPNNQKKIKSSSPLASLKDFDPQMMYPNPKGKKPMSAHAKQREMGDISNLITDMTIKGATQSELARAVRHSMVVIDAEKHNLDYKRSYGDNNVRALKEKYQAGPRSGADTLISKASSQERVPLRKPRSAAKGGPVDPVTGKKVYETVGGSYLSKTGKETPRTQKSTKMAEADNAYSLVSKSHTVMETIYADHANGLKSMGNAARKTALATKPRPYNPTAKTAYSQEVASLNSKLNTALKNKPLERQAQVFANAQVAAKRQANPDMDPAEIKKLSGLALTEARNRAGAQKSRIELTDREWEAIQAGAITANKLSDILSNANLDRVKELATPRTNKTVSAASVSRARSMLARGYTQAEIADALGISSSTVNELISEGK